MLYSMLYECYVSKRTVRCHALYIHTSLSVTEPHGGPGRRILHFGSELVWCHCPCRSPSVDTTSCQRGRDPDFKLARPTILPVPLVPHINISVRPKVLTGLNNKYCYFAPIRELIVDELHLVGGLQSLPER